MSNKLKPVKEYWVESDEDADIANDVARLSLEANGKILSLKVELGDLKRELNAYLRNAQGAKGAFSTILVLKEDISIAEASIKTAEALSEELFAEAG